MQNTENKAVTTPVDYLDRTVWGVHWEQIIYLGFIILALVSRLAMVGARVQSHDESLHTSYSWDLYDGRGYKHNPMTHGPFLFHVTALSYWLFGDNDATARVPVALLGVILVAFPYLLRKQIGRKGALLASFLLLISPSIMFYSRYIRHDIPIIVWSMFVVWAMWSYLQSKEEKYLYWFAGGLSLMFATKEVAFLYVAIFGSFVAIRLAVALLSTKWPRPEARGWYQIGLAGLFIGILIFGAGMYGQGQTEKAAAEAGLELEEEASEPGDEWKMVQVGGGIIAAVGLGVAALSALIGMRPLAESKANKNKLLNFPEFDLVLLFSTLLLPYMAPVILKLLDKDPMNYTSMENVWTTILVTAPMILVAAAIGLAWNTRRWLYAAGVFYSIFAILFTTVFTNGEGIGTGLIGSLGYWLEQQAVERGSQPWYFYFWVAPLYEFLPLLGAVAAGVWWALREQGLEFIGRFFSNGLRLNAEDREKLFGFIPFVLWWTLVTWAVYSYAGEKMGWLTVHFALPMILLAAWFVGRLLNGTDWQKLWKLGGWTLVILLPILLAALFRGVVKPIWFGELEFDQQLDSLSVLGQVLTGALVTVAAGIAIYSFAKKLSVSGAVRTLLITGFLLLSVATIRVAWTANYLNYDNAREFIVYAHGGAGTRLVLDQIEEISKRMHGDLSITVAFDDDVSWPYWWYLRDYPNKKFFGATPSRDAFDSPIVLVGDKNWSKADPYAGDRFHIFEYTFVQWPMEDYKDMTWERIRNALTTPDIRAALWDIVVNRDYDRYGQLSGKSFELGTWPLRHQMRMYLRKDLAAQLWDYGVGPSIVEAAFEDPYQDSFVEQVQPVAMIGSTGMNPGQLQNPRGIAVGPDGLLYVVDWGNHRIQVFDSNGAFVRGWGTFCDLEADSESGCVDPDGSGAMPLGAGQFKEPWGIAVDQDGMVYVTDTWNHRIQKFSSEGEFQRTWGQFGQITPDQRAGELGFFYGPRDIAVSPDGLLYVTDTGNKRIHVYDADGRYLGEFGDAGPLDGQLDEPVGLDFDADGLLYIADTWNGRVEVFDQGHSFQRKWAVEGWFGQMPDNKPYLAADERGWVYVTDPEMYRVLVFNSAGDYQYGFGQYSTGSDGMALPTGIDIGPDGAIYVVDSGNGRVMVYESIQ